MIDPTAITMPARSGGPNFAVETGGTAAGGPDFAIALAGLIATAPSLNLPELKPGMPVGRQIVAGRGARLPDATMALANSASPAAETPLLLPIADPSADPAAKSVPVCQDDAQPVEPRLEAALAWLMPPLVSPPPMRLVLPGLPSAAAANLRNDVESVAPNLSVSQPAALASALTTDAGPAIAGRAALPVELAVSSPISVPPSAAERRVVSSPISALTLSQAAPMAVGVSAAGQTPPAANAFAAPAPIAAVPAEPDIARRSIPVQERVQPKIATGELMPPMPTLQPAGSDLASVAAHATVSLAARRIDDALPPAPLPAAVAATAAPLELAKTGGAQDTGIDLTGDPGLHRMIDRIETLRDAADARDTRIRLIPDALGPVDVSVRREGDAVHVHFTASEAATRQLIADAQPRLAELADARGVRIDRATVDSGATGQGGQAAHGSGQQPERNARTNRTPVATEAVADARPDHRIA